MGVHRCHECSYQTERMYNLKVHQKRKHKHMRESGISTMGVGHAGIVYQKGDVQQPVNQPVYHQPVYYQQPLINGSEPQDHTQLVHHQTGYLGGYDQGGYLSDVGTQTSVESGDEEPDITELLKDTEKNFMDILYIKKRIQSCLTRAQEVRGYEKEKNPEELCKF